MGHVRRSDHGVMSQTAHPFTMQTAAGNRATIGNATRGFVFHGETPYQSVKNKILPYNPTHWQQNKNEIESFFASFGLGLSGPSEAGSVAICTRGLIACAASLAFGRTNIRIAYRFTWSE